MARPAAKTMTRPKAYIVRLGPTQPSSKFGGVVPIMVGRLTRSQMYERARNAIAGSSEEDILILDDDSVSLENIICVAVWLSVHPVLKVGFDPAEFTPLYTFSRPTARLEVEQIRDRNQNG